jgi:hypothetical protein
MDTSNTDVPGPEESVADCAVQDDMDKGVKSSLIGVTVHVEPIRERNQTRAGGVT